MSAFLSPVFGAGAQLFDNSGKVLAGGKIYTYIGSSTTPAATYVDNTQGVTNSNPIILDASGRPPQEVWLQGGLSYRFVVTDASGTPIGYTYDNVAGVNDATYPQQSTTEWATGSTPTYASSTSFTVPGDQTTTFVAGRRIKASVTAGLAYGSVLSSSYGGGVTTVNVSNDSTPLDSGISVLQYGIISPSPTSLPTTLLSASTLQNQSVIAWTTGGGSGAYTITPSPAISAYANNQEFDVTFHTTCGAAPTININSKGAIALVKATPSGTTPLDAGDVVTNWRSKVVLLDVATALVRTVVMTGTGLPVYSDSAALTGSPTAPTQTAGDVSTKLATTGFVAASFAPLASPVLTGNPTAPTQTTGDNSTKLATTAFVQNTAFATALPSQTGNNGKLVTTDGSAASWTAVRTVNGVSILGTGNIVTTGSGTIRELQTATASQTVFNLVNSYTTGLNALNVYINGVRQFNTAYTETSSTVVTFSTGLTAGDVVMFEIGVVTPGTSLPAASVSYSPTSYLSDTTVQSALTTLGARPSTPDYLLMAQGVY